MSEAADCVVIGAGVVGLAIARELALAGREVIVLEEADMIGTGTSSRNSEVIHAGIYYPTGSLKAKLCVEGKKFLYKYCAERGIPHRACTKLIVATNESQIATLHKLMAQAAANDVHDLRLISAAEAKAIEPNLECVAAVVSPSTGIIDSHSLMLAYQGDAEARGAMIAFNAPVLGGRVLPGGRIEIEVGGEGAMKLACRSVVNSAGLGAQIISRKLQGLKPESVPPLHYAKGNYFSLATKAPFSRLIYPVPEPGGLGVHITIDLGGQARFGPDVEWIEEIGYDVDPHRCDKFYAEVRKYWPGIQDGTLMPAYSGIRPKLGPAGSPNADFVIQGPETHGVSNLVQLYGIESPGLTASQAIAVRVAELLHQ